MEKETYVRAFCHHVKCLKEILQKLVRENENFWITQ